MWVPSAEKARPSSPCSDPDDTWPERSRTGVGSTAPPRRARTRPVFSATYKAPSPTRTAMARGWLKVATWLSRARTAARFGPPGAGCGPGAAVRGVARPDVGALRAVEAGAVAGGGGGAVVVSAAAVVGVVDVPAATRSRWWWPAPLQAVATRPRAAR